MLKIRASCRVIGEHFSPAAFAKTSSVPLVDANEPGALGTVGRYRGKPTPYGSASIEVSDKAEADWARFDELLTVVENSIRALRDAQADDITLSCSLFYDEQCNFAFSQDQLWRIAALKVEMHISCYRESFE